MFNKAKRIVEYLFGALKKEEAFQLTPIFIIFFLISFIYNLLRPIKLALVVTAENSGAEIIPFLKLWAILPSVFIFTAIYIFLSNHLKRETVFYIIVGFYIGFFALFNFYLYPELNNITANNISSYLFEALPLGAKGLINIIHYWPLTIFYILAELWGTLILYTLFWGFANEITRYHEAKKFYSFFTLSSNISIATAGYLGGYILANHQWIDSLYILLNLVVFCGVAILVIFRYIHTSHKINNIAETDELHESTLKDKPKKLGISQSIEYLFKSKHLLYIAIIVISYNLTTNLGETLWLDSLKRILNSSEKVSAYVFNVTLAFGLIAIPIDLLVTGNLLRDKGWTTTALITPIVFIATGLIFYFAIIISYFKFELFNFGTQFDSLIIFIGAAHISITRACRASVMDVSKEMAYTPLSLEGKRKGKAVIDSISSRLGKAGGSAIYHILLIFTPTIFASTPYVVTIIIMLSIAWIYAVINLGKSIKIYND